MAHAGSFGLPNHAGGKWRSAARLKDKPIDIPAIREQLKVDAVLSGGVRRSGERLRIAAQLIETASGYCLWAETYDRRIEDLFAIQAEISRAIVDTLKIRLAAVPRKSYHIEAHKRSRSPPDY